MTGVDINDLHRRTANMISFGTIISVDYAKATARVQIGDIQTADLPMMAARAGGTRTWSPFEVGEQVIVHSPSGNLSAGYIAGALYSGAGAAPGDRAGLQRTVYQNGAVVEYDSAANVFTLNLAGGNLVINAAAGVTVVGTVVVTGDVIANGVSLTQHKHGGVAAGAAMTGVAS